MKKKIIIGVSIIVVLVLIGVGVYFVTKQQSSSTDKKEVENNANSTGEEIQEEFSLIDMNNTENVKIENEVKENNSYALLTEKTLLGMKISNIRLVAENGITNFTADVENTSGTDFVGRSIVIVFKNQDGSEYARLDGYLPDIKNGESNRIDAGIIADLSNAYDFTIE